MQSQFDKDELARLTWQKLKPVYKPNNARATHDKIMTLRHNPKAHTGGLLGTLKNAFYLIGSLFTGSKPIKHKQASNCELYGHLMPAAGWTGQLPTCSECGHDIRTPAELRSAMNEHLLMQSK